jgi:excisionase family DNA binding protein
MSDKSSKSPPERLKQALAQHRRALEELESALLEYEEALEGKVLDRPDSGDFELLSIAQVCQRLDMGKSWVYRRIHEGEIPSVKLGRTIKIRRSELEDYLEKHRYQPSNGARDHAPSPPEPSPTKS